MRPNPAHPGFTLIELMITVGLLGLAAMGMLSAFDSQKAIYNSNERLVETQEDARLVLDLIAFDARMAGFMVPPVAAISSIDGGAGNADRLCTSDSGYFDLPDATNPITTLNSQGARFQITNSAQVQVTTANSVTVQSLDIDGNSDNQLGENHFGVAGDGIIISDGQQTFCGGIQAIDTGSQKITLDPAHVPLPAFANPTSLRAVPAILYEVVPTAGGFALMRNGQLLSPSIEDLQVEYWVDLSVPPDNDTDDLNESQISDLNAPMLGVNPSRILRVRISVVSRSTQADTSTGRRFSSGQRPAVANRAAGPADAFGRRVFTATVMPRNIQVVP